MKKDRIHQIRITDYNYLLPENKIAKYPLSRRDDSKLLVYGGENDKVSHIETHVFNDLPNILPKDSLLIFNNTRVIHARLLFKKESGASIEIFCLYPYEPSDYADNFNQRESCTWICMVGNSRRWKDGDLTMSVKVHGLDVTLKASRLKDSIVKFSWNNASLTFPDILHVAGKLPIPPYLNRVAEDKDEETYQTIYSQIDGSVAAPTAGLHFTPEIMDALKNKGIETAEITLHVGAGTFKPVTADIIGDHEMHKEFLSVSREAIDKILNHKGKVIVVGTTSMRTLESLYFLGKKLMNYPNSHSDSPTVEQWDPYNNQNENDNPVNPKDALKAILNYLKINKQCQIISATQLLIAPGYQFHFPDALITNFHQPQSTLLLLVSAFAGDNWRDIYDYALQNNYRFLSYGDSSLIWKNLK